MNLSRIGVFLATLGPVGYLPAPGTVATFLTIPVVFGLRSCLPDQAIFGWFLCGIFLCSLALVHYAAPEFKKSEDPSEIVLDEVVGCLLTFWSIPLSAVSVTTGFVLFRLLDISKIIGIKYVERLPGGLGIMMDDVIAAAVANIILRLIF